MGYQIKKNTHFLAAMLGLAIIPIAGIAQESPSSSPTVDMERVESAMPAAKREIERAQHLLAPGGFSKESHRPSAINLNSMPHIREGLPGINIGEIANSWKRLTNQHQESTTKIKVFISFSMPDESIKRIIDQAHLIGRSSIHISLIGLKGDNDWQLTLGKISELTKGRDVEIQIDPDGFKKYSVNQVPAFVVYRDDPAEEARCAIEGDQEMLEHLQSYVGVYGDVTIEYALNYLKNNETGWSEEISRFIALVEPSLSRYQAPGSPSNLLGSEFGE